MKNSRIFVIVLLALVCVAIATLADPSRPPSAQQACPAEKYLNIINKKCLFFDCKIQALVL